MFTAHRSGHCRWGSREVVAQGVEREALAALLVDAGWFPRGYALESRRDKIHQGATRWASTEWRHDAIIGSVTVSRSNRPEVLAIAASDVRVAR